MQPSYQNPYANPYAGAQYQAWQNPYMQQYQQALQQQLQQAIQQQRQPVGNGFTVRPASNIDEVRATPVEVMTNNVFVNLAGGEVYVSRINNEGQKDVSIFRQVQGAPEETEHTASVGSDFGAIHAKLDEIKSMIGGANHESDAVGNTGNARRPKPAAGATAANADATAASGQ